MSMSAPFDKDTMDQILAIQLFQGNEQSRQQAITHLTAEKAGGVVNALNAYGRGCYERGKAVQAKAGGYRIPIGWVIERIDGHTIRIGQEVTGWKTLYADSADPLNRFMYDFFEEVLVKNETAELDNKSECGPIGLTAKTVEAALEADKLLTVMQESITKVRALQTKLSAELSEVLLSAAKKA